MRSVRICLTAALVCCFAAGPARAGLFECLHGQTITIPPIQFMPMQTPVVVQQPAAQNGLAEILTIVQLVNSVFGGGSNNNGGTTGSGDSASLQRANETLNRVDGKVDKLQSLIESRLRKVEDDVATLQKAQKETAATVDQRLVETTRLIQTNSELIKANTISIQRTQQETAILLALSTGKLRASSIVPDNQKISLLDGNEVEIKKDQPVEVLGAIGDDKSLVRWKNGNGKMVVGTVPNAALKP